MSITYQYMKEFFSKQVFLYIEFVNGQKWSILTVGHSNSHNRLETKEKVVISDDLCFFLVAGMGFEPHDLQVMSLASYRTALPRDR